MVAYSPTRAAPPSPHKQSVLANVSAVVANGSGGGDKTANTPQRARTMINGPRERPVSVHSPIMSSHGSPVAPAPPARAKSQRAPQRALTYLEERSPITPPADMYPQITFHQPPPMHGLGLDVGSPAPSSAPSAFPSASVPNSPAVGAFAVPTLQDPALQKFLQDMASQITALHETVSRNNSPNASPNLNHHETEMFGPSAGQENVNPSSSPYDSRASATMAPPPTVSQMQPRPPLRNASLNGRSENRKSGLGPGGGGGSILKGKGSALDDKKKGKRKQSLIRS